MKKLITIIITLLMMIGTVQAERRLRGTVEKMDSDKGYIVINSIQYRIEKGKTKVFSDGQIIDDDFLEKGIKVYFSVDKTSLITEIRLITPVEFKE